VADSGPGPTLGATDRALLRALIAWGGPGAGGPGWNGLATAWKERLAAAWEGEAAAGPDGARASLAAEHRAEARPDLGRIHSSWFVRGLAGESPAVQRALAAAGPPRVREAIRRGLGLGADDLATDRPTHPEALRWAGVLWAERLVGGPARRPDDPPIVVAMAGLGASSLYRLVHLAGLAKLACALAGGPAAAHVRVRPRDADRLSAFRASWAEPDPRLVRLALWDLDDRVGADRFETAVLGLATVGRLLATADPHRARWALQRLPYPVAKLVRNRMNLRNALISGRSLAAWESRVLGLAQARLAAEGRL